MIDTHAHLEPSEAAATLARARAAGVDRVIAVATTIQGARRVLELSEREDGVFASLGIHPHEAGGDDAGRVRELCELLGHERAVAVGETGLDFYRDYAPHDAQRHLFERQLEIASDLRKPVVIHNRAADGETAELLAGFGGTVILHCFSSPALLPVALERGYYVSFAGNVTFPNAYDLRAAARGIPADRLLVETDSPYLSPQPRRGRPNEPANVVHTLRALADARGDDPAELEAQVDLNATTAFALPS